MTESSDLKREIAALRQRTATLNAAILRINASLDLDTVLGEDAAKPEWIFNERGVGHRMAGPGEV